VPKVEPTRRKYAPIGQCIYCRSTALPLTDEHIIAEGMGGREFLPAASCGDFQREPSKLEAQVQRDFSWALRIALGIKGKRQHPKEVRTFVVDETGDRVRQHIDPNLVPVKGVVPVFLEPPGMLFDAPRVREVNIEAELAIDMEAVPRAQAAGIPGNSIDLQLRPFARMLAKTAHAQAVAHLGVDGFKPYLCDVIRGTDEGWSFYIGCTTPKERPHENLGSLVSVNEAEWRDRKLIWGRVRFFASVGTPIYDVIVGEK
jgi:hypothetical protein